MTEPIDPAAAAPAPRVAAGDAGSRLGGRGVLVGFAVVLGVFLLIAAIAATLIDAPDAPPDCAPGTECSGPPPGGAAPASTVPASIPQASPASVPAGTVGIRAGTPWTSTDFGFEFEYSDLWGIQSSDGRRVDLELKSSTFDAILVVAAVSTSDASAEAYADRWFGIIKDDAPDLRADTSEKNQILGPSIGRIDGVGRTYAGTWTSPQGATEPVGMSLITASDGHTTVALVLVVWNPDQRLGSSWLQYGVRETAETVLKTFRWGSAQ